MGNNYGVFVPFSHVLDDGLDAIPDIHEGFSARWRDFVSRDAFEIGFEPKSNGDLGEVLPFPLAKSSLTKFWRDFVGDFDFLCDGFGGLAGAEEVGGENSFDGMVEEGDGRALGLLETDVVEGPIGVSLRPLLVIPVGLPVADQVKAHGKQFTL